MSFGNVSLYEQIQQDAIMLIESYGFAVSQVTAGKIFEAMPEDEAAKILYSEDMGRIYVASDVVADCLERVKQGSDFFPKGFGTGGMAAYIVDSNGPRAPQSTDMKALAKIYGETDLFTSMQSSFNVCSLVKKKDQKLRADIECQAVNDIIEGANGKLVIPTLLSDEAYDLLKDYSDKGHKVGAALSITSTYMAISDEMVDPFLKTVTRGLPYIMNSMPIGGLTGPYSMSSLATLAQAESLFGLVLGQLINPGVKCINSAMPTIADMSNKDMPMMFGSFANTMLNILIAELNIHHGIPCCQSACSNHRNSLDAEAIERSKEIFSLVMKYDYYMLRHLFGFSAQLNDFGIENMQKQLEIFREVEKAPKEVVLKETAEYDEDGLNAIFEGLERRDFRVLDHTLQNIGKSFIG